MRAAVLGSRSILPIPAEYGVLMALTALTWALGIWVFRRADARIRRLGSLGQY